MPDYEFRGTRLFLEADLAAGTEIEADAGQTNYLLNVLRLEDEALILVFNGRAGEWQARLRREGKRRVRIAVEAQTRPQPPAPDLVYLFAPLKSARLDYTVQKAVEMGAGILQPVQTQHTQAPRFNAERARANAIEAAEQCGVLHVPECREMRRLDAVLGGWDAGRTLLFCDERAESASPLAALSPLAGRPLALLIGPEGGFSEPERTLLLALPFARAISLGPRILRADTAAVAALAVVQAAAGDWRTG
ncbi:16S rRNA (uracil(1498)-N(3))-methyltransferase [Aureimonas jatrophae]|uniref:Ribosomal RNA small subunit methyltransferase E n=1 Tax=Aureimonas jatrophae TaxID=1166073 RepID=A0A1H0DKL7_9HYPH|nr:16S rRNA (uracil(1498)-N(3))-methyltransferase [Aureimonas jatrophae]MBB3951947.1 16S rRNA (uracil1498-N3)-methyltransferase [Aureimonas jatrophae]SDN70710.1 16S rRNA (uracil1498-N3)-methyltransferase [Aureimonas jatrophae]